MAIAALKRSLKFALLLVVLLLVGVFSAVYYAAHSAWCCLKAKRYAEQTVSLLLNADVTAGSLGIDLLPLRVVVTDLSVKSRDANRPWHLFAKKAHSAVSLMQLLSKKIWVLSIALKEGALVTSSDKTMPYFFADLKKLFEGDVQLPIAFKSFTAQRLETYIENEQDSVAFKTLSDVSVLFSGPFPEIFYTAHDASAVLKKIKLFEMPLLQLSCVLGGEKIFRALDLHCNAVLPFLNNVEIKADLVCKDNKATGSLVSSGDHITAFINAKSMSSHDVHPFKLHLDLEMIRLASMKLFDIQLPPMKGRLFAEGSFAASTLEQLTVRCIQPTIQSVPLPDFVCTYEKQNNKQADSVELVGEIWHDSRLYASSLIRSVFSNNSCAAHVWLTSPLMLLKTSVYIAHALAHVNAQFVNGSFGGFATYQAMVKSTAHDESKECIGMIQFEKDTFDATATINKTIMKISGQYNFSGAQLNAVVTQDAEKVASLNALITSESQKAEVEVTGAFISNSVDELFSLRMPSLPVVLKGSFNVKDKLIRALCSSDACALRLGTTHNFVKKVDADISYDWTDQTATIHHARIACEQGLISIINGSCMRFSSGSYACVLPLTISRLFIDPFPATFATLSGVGVYRKTDKDSGLFDAFLMLDDSFLKQNPLSYRSLFLPAFAAEANYPIPDHIIHIESGQPLSVKTSFFDAQIQLQTTLEGSASNETLSGRCVFIGGQLRFPYKPLAIKSGTILFDKRDIKRSQVLLTAEAKIRSFLVRMHVSGTLEHPSVEFESSPSLTKEQIITLLLTGSEEGSLALVMPTLLMQNLNAIIFGPEQSSSSLDSQFKRMILPLKNMRIIPHFTNQDARGGVRGGIEIEVNEQLRALVQKNINLTEDTRIEVEYTLADDLTARAIKDERGDVGAELEFRWKP